MSGLECFGSSSTVSQKQPDVELTSAETHEPDDTEREKTVTEKPWASPAHAQDHSVKVSSKKTQKSQEVFKTEDRAPKESIGIITRIDRQGQLAVEELKMKDLKKSHTHNSAVTGGTAHAPPPAEPFPVHKADAEEEQTEEEDGEEEDLNAPVELIMEFLKALMDRDFQLAIKLCQMILIYDPDNPEASEFLPLIRKKLLEEEEAEQSNEDDEEEEEEEEDDDDDDDDDNAEESSHSSSSSSSSCYSSSQSDDDDADEEEEPMNRHKPCPPCHIHT